MDSSMDIFIDDIITLTIYDSTWMEQDKNMALMVIHNIFCTLKTSKQLTWYNPLSLHRLTPISTEIIVHDHPTPGFETTDGPTDTCRITLTVTVNTLNKIMTKEQQRRTQK